VKTPHNEKVKPSVERGVMTSLSTRGPTKERLKDCKKKAMNLNWEGQGLVSNKKWKIGGLEGRTAVPKKEKKTTRLKKERED